MTDFLFAFTAFYDQNARGIGLYGGRLIDSVICPILTINESQRSKRCHNPIILLLLVYFHIRIIIIDVQTFKLRKGVTTIFTTNLELVFY